MKAISLSGENRAMK